MSDEELVKRLRSRGKTVRYTSLDVKRVHDADCQEAADRIEALAAENAALREALDEIASHDLVAITGAGRIVASKMRMRAHAALQETKP